HSVRLRAAARGLPGVEAEVMVVAAGRDEQDVAGRPPARHVSPFGDDVEAEDVDVEPAHAIDVRRAQMDVPDRDAGVDRPLAARTRLDAALAHGSSTTSAIGLPSTQRSTSPDAARVRKMPSTTSRRSVGSVTSRARAGRSARTLCFRWKTNSGFAARLAYQSRRPGVPLK